NLAKRVTEADGAESRGEHRARHTSLLDFSRLAFFGELQQRAGRNRSLGKAESDEPAIGSAVRAHARHDLLSDIASLGRRERVLQADLVGQMRWIGTLTEPRPSRFDAPDLGLVV